MTVNAIHKLVSVKGIHFPMEHSAMMEIPVRIIKPVWVESVLLNVNFANVMNVKWVKSVMMKTPVLDSQFVMRQERV
jgi:hypothetical protein